MLSRSDRLFLPRSLPFYVLGSAASRAREDVALCRALKIDISYYAVTRGCSLNGVRASTDSTLSALFFSILAIYRSGHFVRDNCANDVGIYVFFALATSSPARFSIMINVSRQSIPVHRNNDGSHCIRCTN